MKMMINCFPVFFLSLSHNALKKQKKNEKKFTAVCQSFHHQENENLNIKSLKARKNFTETTKYTRTEKICV